jgi:hypothetical protein
MVDNQVVFAIVFATIHNNLMTHDLRGTLFTKFAKYMNKNIGSHILIVG